MGLETNPEYHQVVQESFGRHLKEITDYSIITDAQMELSVRPAMFHNEHPAFYMPAKRTFTYEGYTQAGKRFSLTIDE